MFLSSLKKPSWMGLLNYKFYNTTGITVYFAFCKHSDLMPLTRNKPGVLCYSSGFKSPRIQVWVMERHGKYWKKLVQFWRQKANRLSKNIIFLNFIVAFLSYRVWRNALKVLQGSKWEHEPNIYKFNPLHPNISMHILHTFSIHFLRFWKGEFA